VFGELAGALGALGAPAHAERAKAAAAITAASNRVVPRRRLVS
jgi:hypothetical protein